MKTRNLLLRFLNHLPNGNNERKEEMKQKKMQPAAMTAPQRLSAAMAALPMLSAAKTAHLIILLVALPLLLATACRDRDDEPTAGPGKLITVSRLNVSIDGMLSPAEMNAARSAETRTDASADDAGVVKKTFVTGDVLHIMVALTAEDANTNKFQFYNATLEDDGWSFDRLLELPQDPTKSIVQAFYDGTKRVYTTYNQDIVNNTAENGNAYAALMDAWNGTKDDATGLTTYPDLLLNESNVTPASDGTLTIKLIHKSSLVSISSIKNQLEAKVTAIHANTSDGGNPPAATAAISLYSAPADAAAASEKVEVIIGKIAGGTSYLKSFTVTLADGRKFDVNVPNGGNNQGRELAAGKSYSYHLILLPGSITAQEVNGTTPSYKVSRDPAVPAGYIPIYTEDDLRKIGTGDAAIVKGYLYTNASSAILAKDAANNTLIYDDKNGAYTDSGISTDASFAANGTSGSDATSDGSANVGPLTFSLSARYILMNDINLTPESGAIPKDLTGIDELKTKHPEELWTPIGKDENSPFTGRFHGNGFTIRGMTINGDDAELYLGLFGYTQGAVIYNVHMKDARVKGTMEGGNFGSLVGKCQYSTISLCSATGCALQSMGGYATIGGLVGDNSYGTLTRCHAAACSILSDATWLTAGGLVGNNTGILASCYTSSCTASCTDSNNSFGGLAGNNLATIYGCYATGAKISGTGTGDFGSLVGYSGAAIASCYAINAASSTLGLVGDVSNSTITACVSPFEKSSSPDSGNGDNPTGGGSYWEIISDDSSSPTKYSGGYAPLTDDALLKTLVGTPSFTTQGNLEDVRTLLVNIGDDITGDIDMGGGEEFGTPVGALKTIPPGGLYTRKIEWRALGIWGGDTAPNGPTVTLPRIDWTYNGEEN